MKFALTALSLAFLATVSFSGVEVTTDPCVDRALHTHSQIAEALYRAPALF
jgi:hypothetical protein